MNDYKARGTKKPHRRVKVSDLSAGVLSIDIAGPYNTTPDGTRYALVGVFRMEDGEILQYVRSLKRRFWGGVLDGITSILSELSALAGGKTAVRIHSDRAKEFFAAKVSPHLNEEGVFQTSTCGYDPQANGLAERCIGVLKEKAREFIVKGQVPSKYWPNLLQEAARRQRKRFWVSRGRELFRIPGTWLQCV